MNCIKTSYIFSSCELLYLFKGAGVAPLAPARHFTDEYLGGCGPQCGANDMSVRPPDGCGPQCVVNDMSARPSNACGPQCGAADSLIAKGFAKICSGAFILEPIVDFLINSLLSGEKMWEADCADGSGRAVVIGAEGLYLSVQRYARISGSWIVTPYPGSRLYG